MESQTSRAFLIFALGKLLLSVMCAPLIVGVIITGYPLSDSASLPLFGGAAIAIAMAMLMAETRFLHWMKKSYGMNNIAMFTGGLTLLPVWFLFISSSVGAFTVLSGFYAGAFGAEILFQRRGKINSEHL